MRYLALPWLALLGSVVLSGCGTGPYVRDYRADQNCQSTKATVNGVLRETRRTCTDTSTYKIDDYSAGYGAERRIKQTCRRVWELVDGEMRLVDERCDDSERIQPQREYRTHGGRARSSYSTRCTLTLKDWFRCSSAEDGDTYAPGQDRAA